MSFEIINGKPFASNVPNFKTDSTRNQNIKANNNESFKNILNDKMQNSNQYKISKHASERLDAINFTTEDIKTIEKGFELAKSKGSKNSILLYKDVAIIANIPNKTIITAIEKNRTNENVYTNIDSVVII